METGGVRAGADLNSPGRPLVVFVHVPKTAGSFVNSELARWRSGRAHIEGVIDNRKSLAELCQEATWVSGHVPLPRMMQSLASVAARPLRFYTLVRQPVEQIASHYNWLIEIHHRGGAFYEGHPDEIKDISQAIRATDNSSPKDVIKNLLTFAGLFLNQQSRIVLGADVSGWCAENIRTALRTYDGVLPERRRNDLLKAVTAGEIEPQPQVVNKATEHFDRRVFSSEPMLSFLREHHQGDMQLFDLVNEPQAVR